MTEVRELPRWHTPRLIKLEGSALQEDPADAVAAGTRETVEDVLGDEPRCYGLLPPLAMPSWSDWAIAGLFAAGLFLVSIGVGVAGCWIARMVLG